MGDTKAPRRFSPNSDELKTHDGYVIRLSSLSWNEIEKAFRASRISSRTSVLDRGLLCMYVGNHTIANRRRDQMKFLHRSYSPTLCMRYVVMT